MLKWESLTTHQEEEEDTAAPQRSATRANTSPTRSRAGRPERTRERRGATKPRHRHGEGKKAGRERAQGREKWNARCGVEEEASGHATNRPTERDYWATGQSRRRCGSLPPCPGFLSFFSSRCRGGEETDRHGDGCGWLRWTAARLFFLGRRAPRRPERRVLVPIKSRTSFRISINYQLLFHSFLLLWLIFIMFDGSSY
jgi:hypothetical protein